ncbi:MAG: ABC-type multidrug transport system, ATPase and permease component, partial [Clostridia bacterium]|nr:ABC-type multidrug transport system, ATPase and permease component [Clostridia bacterium]
FKRFEETFHNIICIVKKYGFKMGVYDFIFKKTYDVLVYLGTALYASYKTLVAKTMLLGDCLVVLNLTSNVAWIIENSANIILEFHQHSLYIDNLRFFIDYVPTIDKNENGIKAELIKNLQIKNNLEVKNISFKYLGQEKDTLKNISLSVGPKERIALVGHNGAGKSTLVKLLMRLYDPTEGNISLNGKDIKEYNLESYRDLFGVVFQDFKVFSMRVKDNVLLRENTEADDITINAALKSSGVYDKIMSLNKGTDTVLTKEFTDDGAVLSGGEYQKVSIARIFAKECSIAILDEPSSALDPIAEYEMYENMMKACKDCAVIFISHRLSSAVLADKIYMLENGEIIEQGTHKELMKQNGKYADMFNKQAANYVTEAVKV